MEILIPILGIVMGCSIAIVAIISKTVLKMQTLKLEKGGGGNNKEFQEVKKQLGYVMSENEDLQERVRNLEYLMSTESDNKARIPIKETEKIKEYK
ncbi:MAG: hypothetical protein GY810_03100 [Aureispira sp.]|nr:hypothetical protein [Aureispira sp.]